MKAHRIRQYTLTHRLRRYVVALVLVGIGTFSFALRTVSASGYAVDMDVVTGEVHCSNTPGTDCTDLGQQ